MPIVFGIDSLWDHVRIDIDSEELYLESYGLRNPYGVGHLLQCNTSQPFNPIIDYVFNSSNTSQLFNSTLDYVFN